MLHINQYYLFEKKSRQAKTLLHKDFILYFRKYMTGEIDRGDVLISICNGKVILFQHNLHRQKVTFSDEFLKEFKKIYDYWRYKDLKYA